VTPATGLPAVSIPPAQTSAASRGQFTIGAACAVAAVAIWAGWLIMMRLGVTTQLSASDLTALRFAIAGPVLLPIMIRRGFAIDRLGWVGFVSVAAGGGAPVALIIGLALRFAPVAHAGALYQGVVPLAVAGLAAVVLQERVTAVRKLGFLLVLCGGGMIGGLGLASFGGRQSIGDLLFLAAALLTACYTVAIREGRIDGLHAAAIAAVVSALVYVPAYLLFFANGLLTLPVSDLAFQALYQGVLTAAISLALYGRAIRLLGASNAAAFVALGPIIAALLAIPVLGEWPSETTWMGIVLISFGVYLASGARLSARRGRAAVGAQ
jgi:drug/metabolite transporter (DMT)-like permease